LELHQLGAFDGEQQSRNQTLAFVLPLQLLKEKDCQAGMDGHLPTEHRHSGNSLSTMIGCLHNVEHGIAK